MATAVGAVESFTSSIAAWEASVAAQSGSAAQATADAQAAAAAKAAADAQTIADAQSGGGTTGGTGTELIGSWVQDSTLPGVGSVTYTVTFGRNGILTVIAESKLGPCTTTTPYTVSGNTYTTPSVTANCYGSSTTSPPDNERWSISGSQLTLVDLNRNNAVNVYTRK